MQLDFHLAGVPGAQLCRAMEAAVARWHRYPPWARLQEATISGHHLWRPSVRCCGAGSEPHARTGAFDFLGHVIQLSELERVLWAPTSR